MTRAENADLLNRIIDEFYRPYYAEDIAELAENYPNDQRSLHIEYRDVYNWDNAVADDYLAHHSEMREYFEEALRLYDLPVDVDLSEAHVRLTDSHEYIDRIGVGGLKARHVGEFVAIRCQIGAVAERDHKIEQACFECQRCGTLAHIPQPDRSFQEPQECQGCERQGPFKPNDEQTEYRNLRKLSLEAPPEKQSDGQLTAVCFDGLADAADGQLENKAGSRVTVLGQLKSDWSDLFGRGESEPVPETYFKPESIVFGNNVSNEIRLDEKRDDADVTLRQEARDWGSRDDAIEVFQRNIDPGLVVTGDWKQGIEMAAVWLFAAPRTDPDSPEGDTIRGDIHMLFVSDPGMNKSDFASKLAELSPKAVKKDSEGMSSEVALTAAATREGFGDDSWTIQPGALPKANDGHLILDEIDKGPDGFLNGIHSSLEGGQTLNVEKAGQEAELATRCGFLALGNPTEGRFDPYLDIAEQVDLHPALMSRFDLICTMEDKPDRETDREIAEGVLDSIDESDRLDHGNLESSEADAVSGEVPRDVMKAWVKLARQEVQPLLSEAAKKTLADFYVDTRTLNGEDSEKTPATARTLVAGVRISKAYARMELSETVEQRHAERAVSLSKIVVGQNFDPEEGDFDSNRTTETPSSQQERVANLEELVREMEGGYDEGAPIDKLEDRASEELGMTASSVEHEIDKLKQKGELYEPTTGYLRTT